MAISVFLADDNLIVREGVKALLDLEDDLDVIGVAADYDELVEGAEAANPQVVVTDIRMPPNFTREGIEAAKVVRKRHPGTGIVILSQYDDPEYAVSLLSEGAAGYAYMLKDRVGEGNQLARAIREVAAGGSVLDPKIVDALTSPLRSDGVLTTDEEDLLQQVAEGTPIKAIAVARNTTPAVVDAAIEGLSAGQEGSLERLKRLHQAIMEREEQGETLGRLLPGGVAEKLREEGREIGQTEELEVTVLMSDIRGFTTIAEHTDPSKLAGQLNEHRAAMNAPIIDEGGTVMQFAGDSVMAVFGAPFPMTDHADRALAAARGMHAAQAKINASWEDQGHDVFCLGIGLSTGPVAAALIGSEERVEYTVIGDIVNLTQRLQQWGEDGETVISDPTWEQLTERPDADVLEPALVKGRETPVGAHRFPRRTD
jgi:class 3 adenylate cyclase/ActR/RegA family two-component response regulator